MKTPFILEFILIFALCCYCQTPTLVVDVIEVLSTHNVTLVCNVSSSTNLTRWTYLSGHTGTSLMSYQNGRCTVLPYDSFLSDSNKYVYTCSNTLYQVTLHPFLSGRNSHILACRDAVLPHTTGSTWIIKELQDGSQCDCDQTITFSIREIIEGDNVTFICRVSSGVAYVNWNMNIGSNTAAMGVQNGQCTTSGGTTFLDNTSKYIYTCNNTAYLVTRLNVSRSEHNDIYMCTPIGQVEGTGSNWIIKVKAPVTSVTISTSTHFVNIPENAAVEFTCTTSTARPAASVYWYIYPNGNWKDSTQITNSITTTTDYNDFSITTSILRFVPTRQDNDARINCRANNYINTSPVSSERKLLNVLYKADDPYILQGSEYRVIEGTSGSLSCTVKGGNPTPTLSWRCNKFSPSNQATINSNGNFTKSFTWVPLRSHEGTCTCTSTQTGFTSKAKNVSLVVLYPPSTPTFRVSGGNVDGDIYFIEGNDRSIYCTSDSKPSPDRYTWTGPNVASTINVQILQLSYIKKTDAGEYKCSAHNTMNPSNGGPVAGVNSSTVNVFVLYPPTILHMNDITKLEGEQVNMMCNYTAGMPETTSIKWTRDLDERVWSSTISNIESLKRSDAGKYTCTASNIMKQSGDSKSYIGQHNQSFNLNVQYAASITSFILDGFTSQVVTVNESDQFRLICHADSNPTAVMTLRHESNLLVTAASNTIVYDILEARCLDTGIFYCSARNVHHESTDIVQLFVNCYPRTEHEVEMFIKSANNERMSITFKAIAYPPPIFTWFRLVQDNWMELENKGNYFIQSTDLQSTLIIVNVGVDDFTSYKVIAENKLGSMEQVYFLSPYDTAFPSSTPGALIGGIVGGVTGCIVIVVVIIFVFRRYTLFKVCGEQLSRDKSDISNKSAEEPAYYNTGRLRAISNENNDATAYDEIGSVNNYEMVNLNTGDSKPYSTLNQTEQHTTSDITSGENKSVYENMKIEVF